VNVLVYIRGGFQQDTRIVNAWLRRSQIFIEGSGNITWRQSETKCFVSDWPKRVYRDVFYKYFAPDGAACDELSK
jgi:hypothetical protein